MFAAYIAVTVITILANAGMGFADMAKSDFVIANSDQVGVPRSWLPRLGALNVAGAAGLLTGLLGVRVLGIAAATGLVAFFIGAVITHVRARVLYNIAFPGAYLALAALSLAFAIRH